MSLYQQNISQPEKLVSSESQLRLLVLRVCVLFYVFMYGFCHDALTLDLSTLITFYIILFKTVLSSGYILILLSIEYILACRIEMCQGWSRMRNVN